MYYPMRAVVASDKHPKNVTFRYKLIFNIASPLTYPVASDLWSAPSFQDLVTRTAAGQPTNWYRNFTDYLRSPRSRFQLFDLLADPQELADVGADAAYAEIVATLQAELRNWQNVTEDDWLIKYDHE